MHGRVEAPGAVLEAERREDALGELALPVRVERDVEERGVDLRRLADELREQPGLIASKTSATSVVFMNGS